jgi:hypothetical protein
MQRGLPEVGRRLAWLAPLGELNNYSIKYVRKKSTLPTE